MNELKNFVIFIKDGKTKKEFFADFEIFNEGGKGDEDKYMTVYKNDEDLSYVDIDFDTIETIFIDGRFRELKETFSYVIPKDLMKVIENKNAYHTFEFFYRAKGEEKFKNFENELCYQSPVSSLQEELEEIVKSVNGEVEGHLVLREEGEDIHEDENGNTFYDFYREHRFDFKELEKVSHHFIV